MDSNNQNRTAGLSGATEPRQYAKGELSYMDVKEASEYTERFRAESMMLIWKLKSHRKNARSNPILATIKRKESAFLEFQTSEAIKLYKEAKAVYHGLYKAYLSQLMPTVTVSTYREAA